MMYHAELYSIHNMSMDKFVLLFNATGNRNLIMIKCQEETYKHDGIFIDLATMKSFGFDWTRSNNNIFREGELIYKKLGCIESKLNILSSKLLITTDKNENCIATAWHDNFIQEQLSYFIFDAAGGEQIERQIRYTKQFKTFTYENIALFKQMIQRALDTEKYNMEVF